MESSHDEHVLETNGVPRIPCASILVRISLAPNNKKSYKENKIKSYDLNEYDNTRCEPISKTDLAFQSSYLYELHQQQKTLNDKKEKKENEMKQNKLTSLYNTQLISIYNAVSLAFLSNSKAAIIHQPKPIENEQNPNKISTYAQKWLDSLLPSCHIIKLNDLLDYSFVSPYNKEVGIAININQLYNMPNQKKKTVFNAFSLSPHKNTVYKVIYSIYPGSSFYDNSNDNNSNNNNNNNKNYDNNDNLNNNKKKTSSGFSLYGFDDLLLLCLNVIGAGLSYPSRDGGNNLRSIIGKTKILDICCKILISNDKKKVDFMSKKTRDRESRMAKSELLKMKEVECRGDDSKEINTNDNNINDNDNNNNDNNNDYNNNDNNNNKKNDINSNDSQHPDHLTEEEEKEGELVKSALQVMGNLSYGCSTVQVLSVSQSFLLIFFFCLASILI